jgi:mannitol 2-dehydrogenase
MTGTASSDRSAEPLSDANLHQLADRAQVPTYDRSALTPAVVHISVSGFTRAHQLAEQGNTDADQSLSA